MNQFAKIAMPLSAAIATILSAQAALAGVNPTGVALGDQLRLSGSSAVDRTFFEAFVDNTLGVCQEGSTGAIGSQVETTATAIVMTTATSFSSYGNFAISCLSSSNATAPAAGTAIAIEKFSGGSETSLDTVSLGLNALTVNGSTTNINMVDLTQDPTLHCATDSGLVQATSATASTPNRVSYHLYLGCPAAAQIPQAGSSDVNPELFRSIATGLGSLSWQAAHAFPWQIIVSKPLYTALQAKQGITGCGTAPANATAACLPNLTSVQVRGLLSGNINSSTQLFNIAASAGGGQDNAGVAIPGSSIVFCSRSQLSGTRKAHEVMYFDEFCQTSVATKLESEQTVTVDGNPASALCNNIGCTWKIGANSVGGLPNSTYIQPGANGNYIFSGNGTGDVTSCVSYATDNNLYAVGIASADRTPSDAAGSSEYRPVKIDGQAPNMDNVIAQNYQYYTENVLTQPKAGSPNLACGTIAPNEGFNCGDRANIWNNLILTPVRHPNVLIKTQASSPLGQLGFMVRPNTTYPPATTDTAATRPVNSTLRLPGLVSATSTTTPVNDCNPPGPPKSGLGFLRN